MRGIFSLFLILIMFAIAALADVRLPDTPKPTPAPKEKKAIDTYLSVRISKDAKDARLLIPKDQIKQLRAQLDELDNDSNNAALLTFSRTQTIVGGLFLSLAFVFGGVRLTRFSRKTGLKPNKTFAASIIIFLCGVCAAITYANVGPPLEVRSITGKIFSPSVNQYKQAWGSIKLEAAEGTSDVQLIVPDVAVEKKTEE